MNSPSRALCSVNVCVMRFSSGWFSATATGTRSFEGGGASVERKVCRATRRAAVADVLTMNGNAERVRGVIAVVALGGRRVRASRIMKKFQENLLIFIALSLCGLCIWQWVREADLRKEVESLSKSLYEKKQTIQNLEGQLKRSE